LLLLAIAINELVPAVASSTLSGKKPSPIGHETTPLLEHITSAVGGLHCCSNGILGAVQEEVTQFTRVFQITGPNDLKVSEAILDEWIT
jgi:hypothetical protein